MSLMSLMPLFSHIKMRYIIEPDYAEAHNNLGNVFKRV
jgi:hypothetical protein